MLKLKYTSSSVVEAALHEFDGIYSANPLDLSQRIVGRTVVELRIEKRTEIACLHLNFIKSFEQGAGHASKALIVVTDLADKFQLQITAHVHPCVAFALDKTKALDKKALNAWYQRHGFVKWPPYYSSIIRDPLPCP